ncbi:ankyrin repeat-containing domain protein [Aspergillus insuetus]
MRSARSAKRHCSVQFWTSRIRGQIPPGPRRSSQTPPLRTLARCNRSIYPKVRSMCPPRRVCRHTTKAIVRLLVAHGADVNTESSSYGTGAPPHTVVNPGFLDIAECLLENGADVNMRVEGSGTPLHVAALKGSHAMICLLLKHGAKVNVTSGSNERPLQAAIAPGSLACVKLLLDNGAEASLDGGYGYPDVLEKAQRWWED